MIHVSGLTKQYGKRVAVHDLSFDVPTGRVTGFVGPNGAGKSTTMRMMVGLTRPDNGQVRYDGTPLHLPQEPGPDRRVGPGHPLDAPRTHRLQPPTGRRRTQRHPSPSGQGSPGRGRPGIGGRPTGGQVLPRHASAPGAGGRTAGRPAGVAAGRTVQRLGPDGIRWLRHYLSDFAGRGGTVFVSSHLISELSMFAQDLVVVGGGKLIVAESVEAITARNDISVVVTTPRAAELLTRLTAHNLTAEHAGDRLIVLGTTRAIVSQIAFDHRIRLDELTETSRSLEDSLLDLTRASAEFASA